MITEQELGKRIKKARKAIGISQKQLAEKAYISKGTLSYYEQGRTCPPALTLLSLCEVLNVNPNVMLKWNGK